jgi:HSP20 family protein
MIPSVFKRQRDLSDIFNNFDDLFGSSLVDTQDSTLYFPKVDVHEDDNNFYIDADLPGLDKKDISINIENNVLHIKGKRENRKEEKKKGYYRFERHSGEFKRQFQLGNQLDSSKIDASFKDGVLNIVIPKKEEIKPKTHEVTVR